MTQEEKDLLFKDISARLPYHVRVKVWLKDGTTEEGVLDLQHNYDNADGNARENQSNSRPNDLPNSRSLPSGFRRRNGVRKIYGL